MAYRIWDGKYLVLGLPPLAVPRLPWPRPAWPTLQWNIERGYKLADIINTLREVDADVLALQVRARQLHGRCGGSWDEFPWVHGAQA